MIKLFEDFIRNRLLVRNNETGVIKPFEPTPWQLEVARAIDSGKELKFALFRARNDAAAKREIYKVRSKFFDLLEGRARKS